MNTILITGINGFLGSKLAKALSVQNNIIGLEYYPEKIRSDNSNKIYSAYQGIPEAIFTEQHIDIVVHTATFYGKNNEDFIQMFDANLHSPFTLLNMSINHGCQLFINTDTVLDRFVSTYALTKRQFQEWLYIRKNAINVINMQLEHFYGSGASSANFITTMINKLKNNELQIDLTSGEQKRNFVYIEDVVNAYLKVIEKQALISDRYCSYNVCSEELISIKELMILLKELTHSSSILNFGALPYRENEMLNSNTDNSALCALGWKPFFSLIEGLKLTLINSY